MLNYACHILVNQSNSHHDSCRQAVLIDNEEVRLPAKSYFDRLSNVVNMYNIDITQIVDESVSNHPPWLMEPPTICKKLWSLSKKSQ